MDIFLKAIQVLLALSLLVLVHELGHFFFARLFHIRVEKFYLFFNPWFSLFKFKPKNSDTEYGIGWLPLGGYCKISGMIDESMDKEAMSKEPQPWEFRSKPAWQRFFVMFGGVFFNMILAILLYSAILYTWGEKYLQNQDVIYGVACSDLAKEIGFRDGDKILAFGDQSVLTEDFRLLPINLVRSRPETITVLRNGDTLRFGFDEKYIPALLKAPALFAPLGNPNAPFIIAAIPDSSRNASAGLAPGDKMIGVDSMAMSTVSQIQAYLRTHTNSTILAQIDRQGEILELPLAINNLGQIGVELSPTELHITTKKYTVLSALPAGAVKAYTTVANYIQELGLILSPKTEAYKSVGSFIAIGKIFPSSWDWSVFWTITAFLSIMLAVLNMLPIPALDGGHILFVLYEMITGRKPGDRFLEYAQVAGMIILFAIMFLAIGNDFIRLFN